MDEETLAVQSEVERRCLPSPRAVPWLVFYHGKGEQDQSFYDLCDPNQTLLMNIPEMSTCEVFCQSPSLRGWMIMISEKEGNNKYSDSRNSFMWNPVSLETIQLPRLEIIGYTRLHEFVLSSPPCNDDSMVFLLCNEDDCRTTPHLLLYCHPGDKDWRKMEIPIDRFDTTGDIFSFKGRVFYQYISTKIQYVIKELVPNHQSLSINILPGNLDQPQTPLPPPLTKVHSCGIIKYYVESVDELFRVDKYYNYKRLVTLQVWKMNFSSMAWEEVKSLGDHVLFLGVYTTASCSATNLGYSSGCVYFIEKKDKSLYTFDLEDGSISVTLPCPNLPTPWLTPDWFMMPTTVRVTGGRKAEHLLKRRRTEVIIIDEEENRILKTENEEGQTNIGDELEQAGTSSTKIVQTTSLSPWLVFLKKDDGIYNFVDPMHNEKYTVNLSDSLLGGKIYFSKGSWLLMSEADEIFFFFNPLTRVTIKLPYLEEKLWKGDISFSSLPTSSDCIVFFITSCFIFFIARGESSWKQYEFKNTKSPSKENNMEFTLCISNPIFYAEAFYCFDYNGTLGVFDLLDDCSWKVLSKPKSPCEDFDQSFLVECGGKLLALFLGHLGNWVRIYRLDFTRMIWVEVNNLENHMLFVSRLSCFSAVAPPDSSMENKIFFPRFHGEGILFYSLDTGRYHSCGGRHCAPDFYNTKEQIHSCWIQSNWSQPTDQELDWLHI